MIQSIENLTEIKEFISPEWREICEYAFLGCVIAKKHPEIFFEVCAYNSYNMGCETKNCTDIINLIDHD